ncbi:hypothetical protein AGLY_011177 [Aphis glycines]|uniref:Uncharacterized protein n=1 Tax=Aphis glycines TaxID=307491 RepID=A0A6G0TDL7_APHGL|nr:hypothetical protein AGLY_011177 [Aphis glycines]
MDKISLSRLNSNHIWSIFENNNLSIKTVPLSSINGTFLKGFKLSIFSVRCCPVKKKEINNNLRNPNFFLMLDVDGIDIIHFLRPISTTDEVTNTAPIILKILGTSLKNIICHKKANTTSTVLAIATNPASSSWVAIVNNICPEKLNTPRAITKIVSVPHFGQHKFPVAQAMIDV